MLWKREGKVLYFKRIELQGFKSFAEPVTIELNDGITCIVGPNGSGKSNISDAISWVLGEQSPKLLRGGKMDEVIFAGTAFRKSRGMAEVTLVIDNSQKILDVDYSEVAITRRMFRSGESEYEINRMPCRLRDIKGLIADTGIGVDGYSIIRQGKIADIISNRTESRREIFESAAGIVTYRNKKLEAERKLDSARQQLERVDDIVNEIEKRIGGLKEDSEKAALYLELKEKYEELEINITLRNIEKLKDNNEALKNELSLTMEESQRIKEKRDNLQETVLVTGEKNRELEERTQEATDKQLSLIEKINELSGDERIKTERQLNLNKDRQRLEEEIRDLSEKLALELANLESHERMRDDTSLRFKEMSETLDLSIKEKDRLEKEIDKLLEKVEKDKALMFTCLKESGEKRAEAKSIESLKENFKREEVRIREQHEEEEEEYKKALHNKAEFETSISLITAEIQKLKEEEHKAEGIREEYNNKARDEERELEQLKIKEGQIYSRKKTIEEMEANYEGYGYGVKNIMKSGIGKIHGTVAEILVVPQGYEIAVETALGGSIQNIVVEDDETAQKAISYLKENKAGRLTFLPVSSIRADHVPEEDHILKAKGFIGFCKDMVSTDKGYERIKDYLLGKVVVMDSLENAVDLSKRSKGLRFVTPEGEFINANGAITGGKHKNDSGNLLKRKSEIESLNISLKALEKEKEEKESKILEYIEAHSQGIHSLSRLQGEIRVKEMENLSREGDLRTIEDKLSTLALRKENREKEFTYIKEENYNSEEAVKNLEEEALVLEEKAKALEAVIEDDLKKSSEMELNMDNKEEEVTLKRMSISSIESEKQGAERVSLIITKTVSDLKEEAALKTENLDRIKAELDGIGSLFERGDILKELEQEKLDTEEALRTLKEEKNQVYTELSRVTREKTDFDEKAEELASKRMDMEIRQGKNETLLDTYKERLWEEFELSYAQANEYRSEDFVYTRAVNENREVKNRMRELGEVNVGAIMEYKEVRERYDFLSRQRNDITTSMAGLSEVIRDTDKVIKARFKESFEKVAENFEIFFKELFGGGSAMLVLDEPEKPLESEIDIVAQPPGKKLSNINLLSGGEKTLTAIALMFAALKTKPTPFCILDEVEAALDESNINRFINALKHFEDDIQFALVTHQKATMEHADTLYGVTMAEQGISKIISLRLGEEFDLGEN